MEHKIVMYDGDDACNRSCKSDSGAKLLQVLLHMEVNYDSCSVLPDLQSFCSVLLACVHSSPEGEQMKALSVAIDTFKNLHSSKHIY